MEISIICKNIYIYEYVLMKNQYIYIYIYIYIYMLIIKYLKFQNYPFLFTCYNIIFK